MKVADTVKLGIIAAMDVEVEMLFDAVRLPLDEEIAGIVFREGALGNIRCVVAKSGIGKVNAAMCTQAMIDRFDVTHVVNSGAAGSVKPELRIGDIVVATECVQHDVDATVFGYAPGQIPPSEQSFMADPKLGVHLMRAARECLPKRQCIAGIIASGDQFICSDDVKDAIASDFQAACVEMEGAAIARVCDANGVPFAVLRVMSDSADGSEMGDYSEFEKKAGADSAAIIKSLACNMPKYV